MDGDLLSVIQPFVKKGIKLGADELELFANIENKNTVSIEANTLKAAEISTLEGVGIRVFLKKSLGFASISSIDPRKIETALKEAVSLAKNTPADEHNQLPAQKQLAEVKGVYDEAVEAFSIESVLQLGEQLLDSLSKIDSRISTIGGGVTSRVTEKAIVTSTDIAASEKKTTCYYAIYGMAVDGSDIGVFDVDGDAVTNVDEIDIEKMNQRFAHKILTNLGAQKGEPFEGPAILSPYAVFALFDVLVRSSYANAIQSGQSYLQNRLGEQIAVPILTIEDNGTLPHSYASSMFDREGNPPSVVKILDTGKFTGTLQNAYTAHCDRVDATGHASGTFRELPYIAPTNLKIHPGTHSFDQLVSEIKHGLLIQRVSVFPDYISGDFSAALKGAKLIENGQITNTLKEITAHGNLYESLHHITGIENTLHNEFNEYIYTTGVTQRWQVPHIRLDNLKFIA